MNRSELAKEWNHYRHPSVPAISADSTREELINALSIEDANGCYTDADCVAEFGRPADIDDLWYSVEQLIG